MNPEERDARNDPLAAAVVALVGNQPISAARDQDACATILTYNAAGGSVSVIVIGPEGGATEVQLRAQYMSKEIIHTHEVIEAADYWGWNWVRRSERLKRESYLEIVQDALKKVSQ